MGPPDWNPRFSSIAAVLEVKVFSTEASKSKLKICSFKHYSIPHEITKILFIPGTFMMLDQNLKAASILVCCNFYNKQSPFTVNQ